MFGRITIPIIKLKYKLFPKLIERDFYVNLFIKNSYWNSSSPNEEELNRWQVIENFLQEINLKSPNNETKFKILDVGCGRGWLSNLLSSFGDVTGIEPVKKVIKYAKKIFPNSDLKHETVSGLIKKGYQAHYDIIVCSEVIEHILDEKKLSFLKELKILLKKNGFLIITTPRKDAEVLWKQHTSPGQPIEDWLYEKDMEELFIKTSFIPNRMERLSIHASIEAPAIEIYQLWLVQSK